jgi:hypothetical protein
MICDLIKIIFEYCGGIYNAKKIYSNLLKNNLEFPFPIEFNTNSTHQKNILVTVLKIDINTLLNNNKIRVTSSTILNIIVKFANYVGINININNVNYEEKYYVCGRCSKNCFITGFFNLKTCANCPYTERIKKIKKNIFYDITLVHQLTIQHIDNAINYP